MTAPEQMIKCPIHRSPFSVRIFLLCKHLTDPKSFFCQLCLPSTALLFESIPLWKIEIQTEQIFLNSRALCSEGMSESPLKRWPIPERIRKDEEDKTLKSKHALDVPNCEQASESVCPLYTAWQLKRAHTRNKANWFPINVHLLWKQMNILMTCDNLSIYFSIVDFRQFFRFLLSAIDVRMDI